MPISIIQAIEETKAIPDNRTAQRMYNNWFTNRLDHEEILLFERFYELTGISPEMAEQKVQKQLRGGLVHATCCIQQHNETYRSYFYKLDEKSSRYKRRKWSDDIKDVLKKCIGLQADSEPKPKLRRIREIIPNEELVYGEGLNTWAYFAYVMHKYANVTPKFSDDPKLNQEVIDILWDFALVHFTGNNTTYKALPWGYCIGNALKQLNAVFPRSDFDEEAVRKTFANMLNPADSPYREKVPETILNHRYYKWHVEKLREDMLGLMEVTGIAPDQSAVLRIMQCPDNDDVNLNDLRLVLRDIVGSE